jgi:hypothetical protein
MFNHIDGMMPAFGKQKTQIKEELYFAMEFARWKLFTEYADDNPTTGKLSISEHINDPVKRVQLIRM